ncbi:MAG: hypothetical protein ACYDH5_01755 [Acidimicrobiales bacterium]
MARLLWRTAGGARTIGATKARLRRVLGLFWVIDGLLKFQPGLANRADETYSFAMTAMAAPTPLAGLVIHAGHLLIEHPALWWGIGAMELAIGTAILVGGATRLALAGSVAWALCIWVLGEGFEGLSAGATSVVTGFPGAALLYAVLGVLLWPRSSPHEELAASGQAVGRLGARLSWGLLWLGAAMVQLQSQTGPGALDSTLFLASKQEPSLLAAMDRAVLAWLSLGHELWLSLAVIVLSLLIAVMVAANLLPNGFLAISIVLSLIFWLVGQNLGGALSGSGTDIGTAPLFILLALVLWRQGPARASGPSPTTPQSRA